MLNLRDQLLDSQFVEILTQSGIYYHASLLELVKKSSFFKFKSLILDSNVSLRDISV